MKQLIIIGAGGMGKEIYYTARHSRGYLEDFEIKGFLDHPSDDWDTLTYPPILGLEDDYKIEDNDVFVCSIGDVSLRRKVCEKIKAHGGLFYTLISNEAEVRDGVKIGQGTIIDSFAHIGVDVVIGENCLIQGFAALGHDCVIGDYTRIDPRASLVGGVKVEDGVTIHTGSMINHKVVLESNSTVGAMSFVLNRVKAGTTVIGNPAKKFEF